MKQIYLSIRISLFIALITLSKDALAQCPITHNQNGTNIIGDQVFLWGQGFTAECDGNLEYVQLISNATGTVSAGTLNIYNGNSVSGTPLHTQSHPSIRINQVNDPIRVDITGTLSLVQNNQYTFEFTVNYIDVLADLTNGYSGGTAFQSGEKISVADFFFNVSITSALSIDDNYEFDKEISLFPNPSSDFIIISNLEIIEKYSIFNALGQEVIKGSIKNNEEIDIRNFTNGLYFLKFDNGNTLKFIKE